MVSFKEATKPLCMVNATAEQLKQFSNVLALFESKKYMQASKGFLQISETLDRQNPQFNASYFALLTNHYKMCARREGEDSILAKEHLSNALVNLKKALDFEPYWAEYFENYGKLNIFHHQTYGCEASYDGEAWSTSCYKVCRALGLPGVSPGITERLECSICGKDPMFCEHVPGKIYDGRLAMHVAKDMQVDHVAIVYDPMQLETYVHPRPLNAAQLRQFLPKKIADSVIGGRKALTCKDLLGAIQKNHLGGIYWVKQPK